MDFLKKNFDRTFLLRFALAVIMVMHGVTSFLNMSVLDFGKRLEELFGIMGTPVAILVKGIHVVSIAALLTNRYIKPLAVLNIIIFIMGIILVHGRNGWYVVGGGTNGIEFNFLLIFCFLTLVFPEGIMGKSEK